MLGDVVPGPPQASTRCHPSPDMRPEDEDDDIFDQDKPIPWWKMLGAAALLAVALLALAALVLHFHSN
jgi:hypothetical protein